MNPKLAKRLVEPDFWTSPAGDQVRPEPIMTYGPEVADVCAGAGYAPDPQQELLLDLTFAIRPDGSPESFAGCVIACRQNVKTGFLKQAALGWIFVTEDRAVVWSAHEMSATNDAQNDLADLIMNTPFMARQLAPGLTNGIFTSSHDQRIAFRTGQDIEFRARTKTKGRGLARGKLILDEAFALDASMMGSLVPTMMAQPNAQMLYASSPGMATSDVLFDVRDRGRAGKSPRLWYVEWCGEQEDCSVPNCRHPKDARTQGIDCALDREHLRVKANAPGLASGRITLARLEDMRQEMPPAEYGRECMGWWDEPLALQEVIPMSVWRDQVSSGPAQDSRPDALAVDMSHDRVLAIAACWLTGDGNSFVELVALDQVQDTLGAVEWLQRRANRRLPIVIDAASPAASLIPALKARKLRVVQTTAPEMAKACGLFFDDVMAGRLSHAEQGQLDMALAGAKQRSIRDAGGWGWDRRDIDVNIAPLVAVTLARLGAEAGRRQHSRQATFV